MAFDDPVVWVLIIAVVVFLFGSAKIPQFARALGEARKEFEGGWKGNQTASSAPNTGAAQGVVSPQQAISQAPSSDDPLVLAAQKEGIDTQGKTREQIASELSWKLNKT